MKSYLVIMMLICCSSVYGGDAAAGKTKASVCAGCHGQAGVSVMPNVPNLAGRPAAELAVAMNRYRTGEVESPLMSPVAKNLSDADVDDLAAWFESL